MAHTFKLAERVHWHEHRTGWGFAVGALEPLLASRGVLLDVYVEKKFSFDLLDGRTRTVEPYEEPWIGFLHHPPGIPSWHQHASSPQAIFATDAWQRSLPWCRGLFVLSEWMKDWASRSVPVPIASVRLPTETTVPAFSWDAYENHERRLLIQVGWWLRRMHSIHELPTTRFKKVMMPGMAHARRPLIEAVMARERRHLPLTPVDPDAVSWPDRHSNTDYDRLLASSLVFVDLFDAVANNIVVECLARCTPILINPLSSVCEYLGRDYPLYYRSLAEAARHAEDDDRVRAAHEHLAARPREPLMASDFLRSVVESDLYRHL